MHKAEFLETMRRERQNWDALLNQIEPSQMIQLATVGTWSIKDLIGHITWYENQMVDLDSGQPPPGLELWELSLDERNARIYEANQARLLADIQQEARIVFQNLLTTVERLTEDQLQNVVHFPWMEPDWIPWKVIASNCYEHYHQHSPDVVAWLARDKRS